MAAAENIHMALFTEQNVDQAAEAVAQLRKLGVSDHDMSIISGVPYSERILGRPMAWTRISLIGMAGAVVGFLLATALNVGPPFQYAIRVGSMPYTPIPTSIVVTFELTMLGLLIATFLGVFVETLSPSFGPKGYHPKISDGYIGILFSSPARTDERVQAMLSELGGELVDSSEVINP
ncbi:MAG: DUF3341 domain-containing protein [Chloroflexi bacterium]|jgi:hypothetical protein|nr:quinol:electron acceptor oxidoreductase subunit ActD [Anaerolineaceae bacterium]NMB86886.1 DUF3341 domain-containing protein [Chloroflexota bacterium]